MNWNMAQRAEKMNPSVIREILKVTEKPGIISFAGGLPSPKTFPVDAFAAACSAVLKTDGRAALQYAASEGYAPLREFIAASLPWPVDPAQVLITTGSQQALDLIAKILIDKDSKVLVETPTYLGALQAFTPMEPAFVSVTSDAEGIDVDDLSAKAAGARFLYVLPNFQNPTGNSMSEARRAALSAAAQRLGLSFEGIFRQATVVKGRSRDTAWYAAIDSEWPAISQAFEQWLDSANFDEDQIQRIRLSTLTRSILVR